MLGWRGIEITVDTNILARAVLQGYPQQGAAAAELLRETALIAVCLPNLCKSVWILRWSATLSRDEIAQTIHGLLNAAMS